MDDFMAVADTPKLPPLMIINQGKYSYVTTYKITQLSHMILSGKT